MGGQELAKVSPEFSSRAPFNSSQTKRFGHQSSGLSGMSKTFTNGFGAAYQKGDYGEPKIPPYHRLKPKDWELTTHRTCNARELRVRYTWGQALSAYARLDSKVRKKTVAPSVECPNCQTMVPVFMIEMDKASELLKECNPGRKGKLDQPNDWVAINEEKERKKQADLQAFKKGMMIIFIFHCYRFFCLPKSISLISCLGWQQLLVLAPPLN